MREKVGYSLGDVAANLVFQMMMIFQLKFYTDIFGLDGAVASSVLLIARVVDAFVDPAVGIITDRTKTRWFLLHHDSVPSGGCTWLRSLKIAELTYEADGTLHLTEQQ